MTSIAGTPTLRSPEMEKLVVHIQTVLLGLRLERDHLVNQGFLEEGFDNRVALKAMQISVYDDLLFYINNHVITSAEATASFLGTAGSNDSGVRPLLDAMLKRIERIEAQLTEVSASVMSYGGF